MDDDIGTALARIEQKLDALIEALATEPGDETPVQYAAERDQTSPL